MGWASGMVSFRARLLRPAAPDGATWCFLLVPAAASAKLPARGMVTVDGTLAGTPLQATLLPDGQGSHWLKVEDALAQDAEVAAGQTVAVAMTPVAEEPEPIVPSDLREALEDNVVARATWDDITAVSRRDWIFWITSGKRAETRAKRLGVAMDKLAKGNRRACCFDRSGMYDKSQHAPKAALD